MYLPLQYTNVILYFINQIKHTCMHPYVLRYSQASDCMNSTDLEY